MARIRSIKIDLFVDDSLADVSLAAHLLLAGLPVLADSAGRLEDRPRRIQAMLFPYRNDVDVGTCLAELAAAGAVTRYVVAGVAYIAVANWTRDQRPHVKEAESSIPAPPPAYTEPRQGGELAGNSPGTRPYKSAGILDSGLGVLDLGSGILDSGGSQEPAGAVPAREPLVLDGQQPEKPTKRPTKAKAPREPAGDPRHRPLADALVAAGYPFHGGRSAKAVSDLLALADQREDSRGEAAHAEIMRRARIGWAWVGFPSCRSIPELAAHWGHYEHEQQARGQGPPDVRKGGVRAELMDHNAPQEPF